MNIIKNQSEENKKVRRQFGDPKNPVAKGWIPLDVPLGPNLVRRYTLPYNLKLNCPVCDTKHKIYINNYPPNYGSGGAGMTGSSAFINIYQDNSDVKYICMNCWTQFTVNTLTKGIKGRKNNTGAHTSIKESFTQQIISYSPMKLLYGFYMTDSDVKNEQYYDEYDYYPFLMWG